jgi:hypothetical protein
LNRQVKKIAIYALSKAIADIALYDYKDGFVSSISLYCANFLALSDYLPAVITQILHV